MLPLINGKSFDWGSIIIRMSLASKPFVAAKGIKYSDKQEMTKNYGAGNHVTSVGYGPIECEGSITLAMEEIESLQAAVPTGRIQDIPFFDIVVTYMGGDLKTVTHTLKNCKFMENGREVSQGDTEITKELPLFVSSIEFGKTAQPIPFGFVAA